MKEKGFTLIEVIITLAILATLTIAVSAMMKASFDVRAGLAEDDEVTHRLSIAMQKISNDLQNAFIVSSKENTLRNAIERKTGTIFKIDKGNDIDKLYLTTLTHQSVLANASESDQTYVAYELMDDKKNSSYKHLYRGESSILPPADTNFKENPPMKIIARYIKAFRVKAWRGDDWLNDRWDSTRGDTKDKLPRLVSIEIEALAREPSEGVEISSKEEDVVTIKSVVFVTRSIEYTELKQRMSSIKWY